MSDNDGNDNRQRQADELVLISSMFPSEFHWESEPDAELPEKDPQFYIEIPGASCALHFSLPETYPSTSPPEVFLRCGEKIPNAVRSQLRRKVNEAVNSLPQGQECIDMLLTGVMDIFTSPPKGENIVTEDAIQDINDTPVIVHALLWFHHLLSTQKRKNIVTWARPLRLSGYSRPGYPGALFIEGEKESVEEYTSQLKRLKWQAIQVRDEYPVPSGQRVLPLEAGVEEVEGLGDIAERLKMVGGSGLEAWFLAGMKIK
ncbi:unnamed protein product [Tuber aestivum]|uniref:RWD domain-containing protein n=1 Tax=Tuber aestivum TaxID=59557 RepID=A0A292PMS2_9PEZI|nr:unnamed protein product [Tuber aestivum]